MSLQYGYEDERIVVRHVIDILGTNAGRKYPERWSADHNRSNALPALAAALRHRAARLRG